MPWAIASQTVTLPLFGPGEDPGPNFSALVRHAGLASSVPTASVTGRLDVPHGTTVVAVRYGSGVLMAGDRRATSGNLISHRTMEKVFPADRFSAVGIAGAAGPAVEMVKLFQLQLEHYEKVEGSSLSLDGKANQLSRMVQGHLPAAMQGLVVVPLFAGFDQRRGVGRLFQYDVTGGRYEEHDLAAIGSGGLHAATVLKLGWHPDLDAGATVDLALRALVTAADEDSATGGPDLLRGIFPVIATIDETGFTRVGDDDLRARVERIFGEAESQRSGRSEGATS